MIDKLLPPAWSPQVLAPPRFHPLVDISLLAPKKPKMAMAKAQTNQCQRLRPVLNCLSGASAALHSPEDFCDFLQKLFSFFFFGLPLHCQEQGHTRSSRNPLHYAEKALN